MCTKDKDFTEEQLREKTDSVSELNNFEPMSAALAIPIKRRLSKLDLSTPMLRQKRFAQELFGDKELYIESPTTNTNMIEDVDSPEESSSSDGEQGRSN